MPSSIPLHMPMPLRKIAIIGGGVIGTSCAVQIAEQFGPHTRTNIDVHIIAEDFTPGTTGDGSAGLWGPFLLDATPHERIIKWGKVSHDFFHDLWKSGRAAEAGVCLVSAMRLTADADDNFDCYWRNIVFGCKDLSEVQLDRLRQQHQRDYKKGVQYVTFTCQPKLLLPYLYRQFRQAGGHFEHRKVLSFNELIGYDLIINCSGLGAHDLANDSHVAPIRGQVIRVQAPWLFNVFSDDSDDGTYIIPNIESVVLGGTHQKYDYNKKTCPFDAKFIHNGCVAKVAALKNCQVLEEWVGLRPGRKSVRLEYDQLVTEDGKVLKIIHNYGHGGAGVTLSFGCAKEVLAMVEQQICAADGAATANDNNSDSQRATRGIDVGKQCAEERGKVNFKSKL